MKQVANYSISLKVFLQNDRWETLILKTPETSTFKWSYDFPWGRIDQDEFYTDLLEILDREIKEEVWDIRYEIKNKPVAVSRHKAVHKSHVEDIFYCFYEAKIVSWDIKVSHEHNGFDWIKLDEVDLQDYFISWMLDWVKMYLSK